MYHNIEIIKLIVLHSTSNTVSCRGPCLTIICLQPLVPGQAAVKVGGPVNRRVKACNVGGDPPQPTRCAAAEAEGHL